MLSSAYLLEMMRLIREINLEHTELKNTSLALAYLMNLKILCVKFWSQSLYF